MEIKQDNVLLTLNTPILFSPSLGKTYSPLRISLDMFPMVQACGNMVVIFKLSFSFVQSYSTCPPN